MLFINKILLLDKEIAGILKCFDLELDNADLQTYALLQKDTGLAYIEDLYLDEYKVSDLVVYLLSKFVMKRFYNYTTVRSGYPAYRKQ